MNTEATQYPQTVEEWAEHNEAQRLAELAAIEHPTEEQRHLWANARTAHALLSGAPYVYVSDPNAAHEDDLYGDLIIVTWRGQEVVCPVPVVVSMLHPNPYEWYGEPEATVPALIGYAPTEYREREWA